MPPEVLDDERLDRRYVGHLVPQRRFVDPAQLLATTTTDRWLAGMTSRQFSKQSAQRRKLNCLTPGNVQTALQWTLLGLWAALFLGQESFREHKLPRATLSPVKVLRALTRVLQSLRDLATACPSLRELLPAAQKTDESPRTGPKHNRHYPRKKRHQPAGPPLLKNATAAPKRLAKKLLP